MPYTKAATKTMASFQKQYGSNWARVYYGLANKRAGKGLKGAGRGHRAANKAFRKGSHFPGVKSHTPTTVKRRTSKRRIKG